MMRLKDWRLACHSRECPAFARMDAIDYDPEECDPARCAVAREAAAKTLPPLQRAVGNLRPRQGARSGGASPLWRGLTA